MLHTNPDQLVRERRPQFAADLIRLAWTQRRLARENRAMAAEDEAHGRIEHYRYHAKEAARLAKESTWHRHHARLHMRIEP